ncbi:putative bifunctional diguanylate cyclase/phosphodiesterase [Marinobacter sp. X15-166B]|uniref:putative bifunctional diguanylate cyclase/phosphodiesterase n=1 Tax=Marinobacter sp. X15-166B TaxID=1897620 RepID=UPI00085C44FA|nr:GGDEF domain-containing phosphodiesterase [Marinobacter sp. X15-166B]OEY65116.1 diguanylate cyclase [Marinobacter sp. X15-166B]
MIRFFQIEQHLGYKILRWVLTVAVVSGILLSVTQVALDAKRVSAELDEQAQKTLKLMDDAATQAVFSLDPDLARQVVDGLLEQPFIHLAKIADPDETILEQKSRPLIIGWFRFLTDTIFGADRAYHIDLTHKLAPGEVFGNLEIHYDTAPMATIWLKRALLSISSGIAQALFLSLLLFMVYHWLLTKPLLDIVQALKQVNPEHPDDRLITVPAGHAKDELGLWVNTTNNLLVAIAASNHKQREVEERITRISQYDQLTGLARRETLLRQLDTAINNARDTKGVVAVYCMGVDDFNGVNDQHSYAVGDRILQILAERLGHTLQHAQFEIARLSGDQFVVVEKNLVDGFQAAATADRLLEQLSAPIHLHHREISVTVTIGIALYPADSLQAGRLLQCAEQAMTLAKESGNNHFQFYVESVGQEIRERRMLGKALSFALQNRQFHLVYQPQISLQSGRVSGVEALLRWRHPDRGLVPPDEFIPLAELNGTIVPIGHWVLDEACRQAALWAEQGLNLRIAVNLSAVQLRQPNIVESILAALARHKVQPGKLELEITETSFMTNLEDAIVKLQQLSRQGICIAVDDFGTGYSSLTYLKRMPIKHLKIDKQFASDLLVDDESTQIANTIIDLGSSLNLSVIAEGVETAEQEYYLRQRGCQLAQGYHFSKPILPEDMAAFVAGFHRRFAEHTL